MFGYKTINLNTQQQQHNYAHVAVAATCQQHGCYIPFTEIFAHFAICGQQMTRPHSIYSRKCGCARIL